MPEQNELDSEQRPMQAESGPPPGSGLDRVHRLQEKMRHLDETLERVEKTLDEAAGASRSE